MKKFAALWLPLLLLGQQPPEKKADACAPPPGSVAPTLPARLLEGQGTLHFKITTRNPQAQAFFNQGLAQMHSFWAREAERSFLQAAALDPEAPMPQWGIAMTASGDYRPGFQLDLVNGAQLKPRKPAANPRGAELRAIEAARKATALASAPGKATELEKMYIAAVAARRDRSIKDPSAAYVAKLRELIARYPAEVEARSYLALQIMSGFELPSHKPRSGSIEAVDVLKQLLTQAPEHPGVHHYVIHGWEGSTFARDAWPSCKRYGELVHNIPHGLHMPGHIYAQTGRWDDAVRSFSSAAANDLYWMKQDSLGGNGHHGHNVHFLASSYSFAGHYEKAVEAARGLLTFKETPREAGQVDNFRTAYRQGWFALMRVLVQHEKWDLLLDGTSLPVHDKPRERAWRHWALALAHLGKSNAEAARNEAGAMQAALADYKAKTKQDPPPPLLVAQLELKGHLAGSVDKRLGLFEKAARRELALRYTEPTSYPRPVLEVLGKVALENKRADVAERAFRRALEQYPESAGAKAGLRAALERENRPVEAGF